MASTIFRPTAVSTPSSQWLNFGFAAVNVAHINEATPSDSDGIQTFNNAIRTATVTIACSADNIDYAVLRVRSSATAGGNQPRAPRSSSHKLKITLNGIGYADSILTNGWTTQEITIPNPEAVALTGDVALVLESVGGNASIGTGVTWIELEIFQAEPTGIPPSFFQLLL